jgi:hypothetical protein
VHDQQGSRTYTTRDPAVAPSPVDDAYEGVGKGDMVPAFVAAILDGGEPEVCAADVLDAMSVSLAIEQAAKLENTVRL